jgi:hypothetical protein
MPNRLSFTIAGLPVALHWQPDFGAVNLPQAFLPFQAPGQSSIRLALSTEVHQAEEGVPTFDASPIWSLYRVKGGLSFRLFDAYPDLKRRLFIPDEGADACLTFLAQNRDPFVGPSLELLVITHLARCGGAILHGCGISFEDRGIVFAGESGAGKSTLCRLWAQEKGVEILSDDRVIVRRRNGAFRLYGSPWHGEEPFAAPGGVELSRIFFIRYGPHNLVQALTADKAVAAMLQCSFPPLWDAGGMAVALELFHALAAATRCAELTFMPDARVIEFVRRGI